MESVDESVSGFEIESNWGDVVELGERITQALLELEVDKTHPDAFEEWQDWRPKSHERFDDELNEKTAEQAHLEETDAEQEPTNDLRKAGEKLSESVDKLGDDADAAVDTVEESVDHVSRAAASASRKAIRKVEDTVYKRVMTQVAPYYFDNELISANIQRIDEETFVFEININDDDLKDAVSEQLQTFDDAIDRWHVRTQRDTTQVEAAEGVESPQEPTDREGSQSTIN